MMATKAWRHAKKIREARKSRGRSNSDGIKERDKMTIADIRRVSKTNLLREQLEETSVAFDFLSKIIGICIAISTHQYFTDFITSVILIAGILAGVRTGYEEEDEATNIIEQCDLIIAVIFLVEVIIKIAAQGMLPWRYFHDSWNVFDFVIVVLLFSVEKGTSAAQILPLVRLFRVLKLVNAIPALQILVSSLLKSLVSIGSVFVLLFILFYIYTVLAVFLYAKNDPFHFGTLETAMLTMYRVSTFEDWTDVMYINMFGCAKYGGGVYQTSQDGIAMQPACSLEDARTNPNMQCTDSAEGGWLAAIFFCSFSLFATMIMFNLFIGVILGNMEKAKTEITEEIERMGDIVELRANIDNGSFMDRRDNVTQLKVQERWDILRKAVTGERTWRVWKGSPDEPASEELTCRLSIQLLKELDAAKGKLEKIDRLRVLLEMRGEHVPAVSLRMLAPEPSSTPSDVRTWAGGR